MNVRVYVVNSSDHPIKIVNAQFQVRVPGKNKGETVFIKTPPLTNTVIPGYCGAMIVSVPWKVDVPEGQYNINPRSLSISKLRKTARLKAMMR